MSDVTFSEVFWEALPEYLLYGMTADQYWNGPPRLVKSYKRMYELKQQEVNSNAWLQGMYIYEAYAVVNFNLNRKKGQSPQSYSNKPYDFKSKSTTIPKKDAAEVERKKAIDSFNRMKAAWDMRNGK